MSAGAVPVGLAQHGVDLLALAAVVAGPLPLTFALAASQRDGPHALPRQALAAATAWCVLQTAAALVLGSLGALHLPGLLAAESVLAAAGVPALARLHGWGIPLREALRRADGVARMLLGVVGLVGMTLLVRLARTPITEHDSLRYHLTALVTWYQHRGFVPLEGFHYGAYYPYGWEALAALFVIPFGEDFLVALPNLVAWMVLGVAVHVVASELGARRVAALAAMALLLATPLVWRQVTAMRVDLALAAFFVAGLAFALGYQARRERETLALLVGALGLIVGVKMSGLWYAAMLLGTLGVLVTLGPRPATAKCPCAWSAVAVVAAGLWVGLFWYVRNVLQVGNPLGDVAVAVGGHTLFPGAKTPAAIAPTTLLHCFHLRDLDHWRILLGQLRRHLDGPFVVLAALAVAGLPAGLRPMRRAAVVGLMPVTALAYWATPYSADNGAFRGQITPWIGEGLRYALPFFGVVAAVAGLGASRLGTSVRLVGIAAAALALGRSWSTTMGWVVVALGTIAATAVVLRQLPARAGRLVLAGVLVAAVLGGSFRLREQRDVERRLAYGDVAAFLAANSGPGELVGCAAGAPCYVLFDRALERRVARVPWSARESSPWMAEIDRRQLRLLAVGPLPPDDPRPGRLRAAGFAPVWRRGAEPALTLYRRSESMGVD